MDGDVSDTTEFRVGWSAIQNLDCYIDVEGVRESVPPRSRIKPFMMFAEAVGPQASGWSSEMEDFFR